MAQHDYSLANQSGAAFRADLNNGLAAIVSNNSGASEPSTMYAYQWWADTTTGLLKQRNAANNAWITIGTLASANLGLLASGGTLTAAAGSAGTPSITFTGATTNTGIYSPGADQVAISTNGTEATRIDSSNRLLVGTPTASNNFYISNTANTPQIQLEGATSSTAGFSIVNTNAAGAARLHLAAGSSGNTVTSTSNCGVVYFSGYDGANYRNAATITAAIDNTPGSGDMPGRLVFSTTADGASIPTERMRITSDAYVRLASGTGGIQFNGNTAAVNALDDYEEGTYTVNFYDAASAGNTSATTTTGNYTKIGNTVTTTFSATNISTTGLTAANNLYFSLPFTSKATVTQRGSVAADTLTFTSGYVCSGISSSATRGFFERTSTGVVNAILNVSSISTGVTDIVATITYQTA